MPIDFSRPRRTRLVNRQPPRKIAPRSLPTRLYKDPDQEDQNRDHTPPEARQDDDKHVAHPSHKRDGID